VLKSSQVKKSSQEGEKLIKLIKKYSKNSASLFFNSNLMWLFKISIRKRTNLKQSKAKIKGSMYSKDLPKPKSGPNLGLLVRPKLRPKLRQGLSQTLAYGRLLDTLGYLYQDSSQVYIHII